jgi:hypothetical protein
MQRAVLNLFVRRGETASAATAAGRRLSWGMV